MQKFKLTAQVTVSAYTLVEAETLDAAIKIAGGRLVSLGQEGEVEDDWVIGEADGEPCEIHEA